MIPRGSEIKFILRSVNPKSIVVNNDSFFDSFDSILVLDTVEYGSFVRLPNSKRECHPDLPCCSSVV
jgi:hypothetical protein